MKKEYIVELREEESDELMDEQIVESGTALMGKGRITVPDRKKVIKGLEICTKRFCDSDCPYYRRSPKVGGMCTTALQADALAILQEQEATKWISTAERLPKSNPEDLEYPIVIIALEDGTVELGCFYESTKEWGAGENFDRLRKPVAWMPLPEAPEKRR